jgi:ankyrin repeat protein
MSAIDLRVEDNHRVTPMTAAIANETILTVDRTWRWGVVHMLLETGLVEVDGQNKKGATVLMLASAKGDDEIVEKLLYHYHANISKQDESGQTAMSYAATMGRENILRLLLQSEEGRKLVICTDNFGETPLMLAAKNGRVGAVRILLETGLVDINAKDRFGSTALELAKENKRYHPFWRGDYADCENRIRGVTELLEAYERAEDLGE